MKKLGKEKEFLTVTVRLEVNGKFIHSKKVAKYYRRGRETYAFTLDDFARVIFSFDSFGTFKGSTYAMDGLLQKMEKLLPKKEGETAKSVFEKYWINANETRDAEFKLLNKGNTGKFSIFKEEGQYLKWVIASEIDGFHRSPLSVKYAFVYWLHKYVYDSNLSDIEKDLADMPNDLKLLVDGLIKEAANLTE